MTSNGKQHRDIHQEVTDRVIAAVKRGVPPWQRPWTSGGAPRSMSTGKLYKGMNIWLTGMTAMERGYKSPYWGTYQTIAQLGGQVRQGESEKNGRGGTLVVVWNRGKPVTETNDDGEKVTRSRLFIGSHKVFNAEQADGLPEKYYAQPSGSNGEPMELAQAIADGYFGRDGAPTLIHDQVARAYYQAEPDVIHLPKMADHVSTGEYYSTLFHEAGHSTGHKSRLDRDGIREFGHFGDNLYSKEELVAEMTATMVCAEAGIDTDAVFDNSAAYIGGWLRKLGEDNKLLISAASKASHAADLILGREAEPEAA
jgi:antirestriction protein ArdC